MSPIDPPPPNTPPPPTPGGGSPAVGNFDVGDAFRWGWKKFQENLGPILIATIVLVIAVVVLQVISNLVTGAIFDNGSVEVDPDTFEVTGGRGFFASIVISLITSFLGTLVAYLVQAGIIRGSLKIADGGKPELSEILATDKVAPTIVTAIIITVGTYIGLVLCILPGLIFAALASFSLYFLLDKGAEPMGAVKSSITFVRQNIGQLILLFLASIAALIVGAILCGVGLLVAIPVVILANTYAFRTLTGGRVAA